MSKQVRVGIIGTSWWTDSVHLAGLKSHPGATVAALCGRDRDRAQQVAAKHDIPTVYTDYQDMLAHGDLEAVVIATPDDQHYAMVMAALEAGLHVLCEKPLATTAEQARTMYQAAERAGVRHMTFFTWRWVPEYRYTRELIAQGYLGRLFHCRLHFVGNYGLSGEYNWRFDRQRAHGVLGDLGSHMVDIARWCCGEIARVSAHLATFVTRPGPANQALDPANDAAMLLLEFASGAQGVIQVSAVGRGAWQQRIVMQGEDGTLDANGFGDPGARLRGSQGLDEALKVLPMPENFWGNTDPALPFFDRFFGDYWQSQSVGDRLFIDAVLEDHEAIPDFHDGWRSQAVIEAAIQSDRIGQWVDVV
jgi:predicted dehydrogenase